MGEMTELQFIKPCNVPRTCTIETQMKAISSEIRELSALVKKRYGNEKTADDYPKALRVHMIEEAVDAITALSTLLNGFLRASREPDEMKDVFLFVQSKNALRGRYQDESNPSIPSNPD